MSAVRHRRHRDHGQSLVSRAQHTGAGDAERDGQGHGRPGRVSRGVRDRSSCRRLRVLAHVQRISIYV